MAEDTSIENKMEKEIARLQLEKDKLTLEVKHLKTSFHQQEVNSSSPPFPLHIDIITDNLQYYTGFDKEHFQQIYKLLDPNESCPLT